MGLFEQFKKGLQKTTQGLLGGLADLFQGQKLSDEALKVLQEAFEKHYPAQYAAGDADLDSLQSNPQFTDLVNKYSASSR